MNYQDIITLEPGKRGGKPCIRGMRITAEGVTSKQKAKFIKLSSPWLDSKISAD